MEVRCWHDTAEASLTIRVMTAGITPPPIFVNGVDRYQAVLGTLFAKGDRARVDEQAFTGQHMAADGTLLHV